MVNLKTFQVWQILCGDEATDFFLLDQIRGIAPFDHHFLWGSNPTYPQQMTCLSFPVWYKTNTQQCCCVWLCKVNS